MRKASKCWCPMARNTVYVTDEVKEAWNRPGEETCIGSGCACWVQTLSHEHAKEWDDVPQGRCGLAHEDSQEMTDDAEAED